MDAFLKNSIKNEFYYYRIREYVCICKSIHWRDHPSRSLFVVYRHLFLKQLLLKYCSRESESNKVILSIAVVAGKYSAKLHANSDERWFFFFLKFLSVRHAVCFIEPLIQKYPVNLCVRRLIFSHEKTAQIIWNLLKYIHKIRIKNIEH